MVLNTCYSFLHDAEQAQDITQEVFVEAFLSIHKFSQQSRLSTWLYRIAVNKSLNHIRNNKKRSIMQRLEQVLWQPQADYEHYNTQQDERFAIMYAQIEVLPKKQKVAFTLSQLDKRSYKEIADIMQLSVSAVESLIHRARKNVKKGVMKHLAAAQSG